MMTDKSKMPHLYVTVLYPYIISWIIGISYSSSVDSAIFIRLRSFDGYLHKTYNLTDLISVKSKTVCALICMKNLECGSFFYLNKSQKLCQIHSVLFMTTNEAVDESSASYYQLTQARCPHNRGYILYRPASVCYRYYSIQLIWTSSNKKCRDIRNSHLINVKTPEISNHVVSFLSASSNLRYDHVSIGATLVSGSWSWSDKTPVTWTNWEVNEPSGPNENCLCIAYFYYFKWNDVPCDEYPRAFICQLDI